MGGSSRGNVYFYGQPEITFVSEDTSESSCTLDQRISRQNPMASRWVESRYWPVACLVLRNSLRLSGDAQEPEKWWGQAPSLLGSLSDAKSGPCETVLGILETTWRTRFVTPSIGQLSRTGRWLRCHRTWQREWLRQGRGSCHRWDEWKHLLPPRDDNYVSKT